VMTEIPRDGAQRMLATAIEAEVADWIDRHAPEGSRGGLSREAALHGPQNGECAG
jgi:hypothetical protein